MSDVKRFSFEEGSWRYNHPSGEYIQHSDYAKLEAEAQALRDGVAALRARVGELNMQAGTFEELMAAAVRARVVVVPDWQPLTDTGQVEKGDLLRFTVAGKEIEAPAQLIMNAGTAKEEIVYNRGKNHYFITSMAVDGTSSHKGVMFRHLTGKVVGAEELADLRRDAERYRWVKQRAWYVDRAAEVYEIDHVKVAGFKEAVAVDDDDVEAAIDKAMSKHALLDEGKESGDA